MGKYLENLGQIDSRVQGALYRFEMGMPLSKAGKKSFHNLASISDAHQNSVRSYYKTWKTHQKDS